MSEIFIRQGFKAKNGENSWEKLPEMKKNFFHCYEYEDRTESGFGLGTDHYGLGNVFWAEAQLRTEDMGSGVEFND